MEDEFDQQTATLPEGTSVRQFSVMLKNRAGALSSLLKMLESKHIVPLGFSVRDSIDATIVRLIVSDPETTQQIFLERGIPHTTTKMAVLELGEGCQNLSKALDTLFKAETNIHFAYSLVPCPQGKNMLALCLEDYHFGCSVLRNSGFKVLFQEDISR